MKLRLGTRASLLARTQSGHVAGWLRSLGHEVDLVPMTTEGDRRTAEALADIGGKGLFLKELEEALLEGAVDFAVHSLKDVPTSLPGGLVLAGTSKREDPRDALVSKGNATHAALPAGARVGTGSLRRGALMSAARPDVEIVPIRGNVDTRMRKVADGELDGVLLAAAGLSRLGRLGEVAELLSAEFFPPAPGQGILGFECLAARADVREALRGISDEESERCARAERALLAELGGDCRTPLGAYAVVTDAGLTLSAFWRHEASGRNFRGTEAAESGETPEELGRRLARRMLAEAGL